MYICIYFLDKSAPVFYCMFIVALDMTGPSFVVSLYEGNQLDVGFQDHGVTSRWIVSHFFFALAQQQLEEGKYSIAIMSLDLYCKMSTRAWSSP